MSDYNNEYNRGYNDPTYKGSYDARAASEGRDARFRDETLHDEAMARHQANYAEAIGGLTSGGRHTAGNRKGKGWGAIGRLLKYYFYLCVGVWIFGIIVFALIAVFGKL